MRLAVPVKPGISATLIFKQQNLRTSAQLLRACQEFRPGFAVEAARIATVVKLVSTVGHLAQPSRKVQFRSRWLVAAQMPLPDKISMSVGRNEQAVSYAGSEKHRLNAQLDFAFYSQAIVSARTVPKAYFFKLQTHVG